MLTIITINTNFRINVIINKKTLLGSHPANISIDLYPVILFAILLLIISLSGNMGAIMKHSLPYPEGNQTKNIPLLKSTFRGAFLAGSDVHLLASNFPAGRLTHPWMGLPDDMPYGLALANVLQRDYIMKQGRGKKEFQTTRPSINRSTR